MALVMKQSGKPQASPAEPPLGKGGTKISGQHVEDQDVHGNQD